MRRRPLRMNLCTVLIRRLLTDSVPTDDEFSEPAGEKQYSNPEEFRAQFPRFHSQEKRQRLLAGNVPGTDGYLAYPTPADPDKVLKMGDLLVGIPTGAGTMREVEYVIDENRATAPLPEPMVYIAVFSGNTESANSVE